jgi:hypothetical protein
MYRMYLLQIASMQNRASWDARNGIWQFADLPDGEDFDFFCTRFTRKQRLVY